MFKKSVNTRWKKVGMDGKLKMKMTITITITKIRDRIMMMISIYRLMIDIPIF